jgi:hypothetical protein
MAALAPLATLASTGVGLYAQQRSVQQAQTMQRAQADQQREQQEAQRQQLLLRQQTEARERTERLERTLASTRARLAAGGLSSDDGSAATVQEGLRADAAAGQRDSDALYEARLASGRASLLNPDGGLTTVSAFLRVLPRFGTAVRSLLD